MAPTIYLVAMILTCAYATWKGGAPERLAAATIIVAAPVSFLIAKSDLRAYFSFEAGVFIVDLTVFGVFLTIALFSTRYWPMAVTSLQAVSLLAHTLKPADPTIGHRIYYILVAIWSYPQLALLAGGTFGHQIRLRHFGIDYAWSRQLPEEHEDGGGTSLPEQDVDHADIRFEDRRRPARRVGQPITAGSAR